jgi:hypothetical protein
MQVTQLRITDLHCSAEGARANPLQEIKKSLINGGFPSLFFHVAMKIDKSRIDVAKVGICLLALDRVPALAERSSPLPSLLLGLVFFLLPLGQDLGVFCSSLKCKN